MPHPRSSRRASRALRPLTGVGILAGLLVGACSVGTVLESAVPDEPDGEPGYRQLIADGVQGQLTGVAATGFMEVSGLRRSMPVQPGDWIACLRRTDSGDTAFFAVFIKSHKIDSVRRAVLIDKCEGEAYGPLPKPTPPKQAAAK